MRPAEEINQLIKKISLKASANLDKRVSESISSAQVKQKDKQAAYLQPNIWRNIMKNPITRLATAAAIIIAALIVFNQFDKSNVVFADMIKKIEGAKTLVFETTFLSDQGKSGCRTMILGEHLLRFELSDGQVWIIDQESEEALILNPNNNTAIIGSTDPETLDLYDSYANFKDMPGSTVKEVRNDEINGKRAVAFYLEIMTEGNNENDTRNVIVWADPETQLPILMKGTMMVNGSVVEVIMDNIIFDGALDESLFSFDIPSGYNVIDNRGVVERIKSRMESGLEMNLILKSCRTYEGKHGVWPNNLQELGLSDIDVSKYVYLKPSGQIDDSTMVLYQDYNIWEEGTNAGFGNFQVQFIRDEKEFKSMLEQE